MAALITSYPKSSVALHWVSAALILANWPIGKFLMDDDSLGFRGPGLYTIHIWLGLTVFVLTIIRVIRHFATPQPEKLPMPMWERVLFTINHYGLYIALLLLSFTGIGMLIAAGSVPIPGSTYKPDLYGDTGPADLHEGPAIVLMILFVMHIAGVAFYQATKGRTIRRMGVPVGPDLAAAER